MYSTHHHHGSNYYPHHHHHGSNYYPHHHHHNRQANNGVFIMFIGLLLGSPFLIALGYLQYATAPMLVAASSATALGLSTLAISSLILYGSIGVAYLISGARQCYNTEQGPFDLLKSRVVENSFSLKGVASTLGAILWSPFLFVGGIVGTTAKAVSGAFSAKPEVPPQSDNSANASNSLPSDTLEKQSSSHQKMISEFDITEAPQAQEQAEDEPAVLYDSEWSRKIREDQEILQAEIESNNILDRNEYRYKSYS